MEYWNILIFLKHVQIVFTDLLYMFPNICYILQRSSLHEWIYAHSELHEGFCYTVHRCRRTAIGQVQESANHRANSINPFFSNKHRDCQSEALRAHVTFNNNSNSVNDQLKLFSQSFVSVTSKTESNLDHYWQTHVFKSLVWGPVSEASHGCPSRILTLRAAPHPPLTCWSTNHREILSRCPWSCNSSSLFWVELKFIKEKMCF